LTRLCSMYFLYRF